MRDSRRGRLGLLIGGFASAALATLASASVPALAGHAGHALKLADGRPSVAAASASYDQSARTLTVSWVTPARDLCAFDVLAADRLSARGLAEQGHAAEVSWPNNQGCALSPWTVPATFTNDFYVQVGFHCLKKPGQCAGVPGYDNGWSKPVKVILDKTAPIDCATAQTLARAVARPVWFPVPQPPGRLTPNTNALPIFVHGLEWLSGRRYFWLVREPHGANLGEIGIRSKIVAHVYLSNLHDVVKVLRLAGDGRLYAEWPTRGRYPDVTAAVARGETIPQFLTYLRSLGRIAWPARCAASAAYPGKNGKIVFVKGGDLWKIDADGRSLTRLTKTSKEESAPTWSLSGRCKAARARAGRPVRVEQDADREGEDPLGDSNGEPGRGFGEVVLKPHLAFEVREDLS